MAVSKRLRFEILRRDNHTCRYCGATAPGVKLVVDHVVPEALGGRSEPENLVAACDPCNSGKSSVSPDAAIVADVKTDAMRWAKAMKEAHETRRLMREERQAYVAYFGQLWAEWTFGPKTDRRAVPLPDDWQASIEAFHNAGLEPDDLAYAVQTAMVRQNIRADATFKYFCGIAWSIIRETAETARDLFAAGLAQDFEALD